MFRRIVITTLSAVAGMALVSACLNPAQSQTFQGSTLNPNVVQQMSPMWKDMGREDRDTLLADAYKVAIAYNYCREYTTPKDEVSKFVIWIVAQAEGLTLRRAGVKMDEVAWDVWRQYPPAQQIEVCGNAIMAELDWIEAMK